MKTLYLTLFLFLFAFAGKESSAQEVRISTPTGPVMGTIGIPVCSLGSYFNVAAGQPMIFCTCPNSPSDNVMVSLFDNSTTGNCTPCGGSIVLNSINNVGTIICPLNGITYIVAYARDMSGNIDIVITP
jgi:hypothetical protein